MRKQQKLTLAVTHQKVDDKGCEESFTLLIYKENRMKEYDTDKENENTGEEAYLNLDMSILTDRNTGEEKTSGGNWYGIRIFDKIAEEQIQEHQNKEKEEIAFYKGKIFFSSSDQTDKELEYIRDHVFAAAAAAVKKPDPVKGQETVWGSVVMVSAAVFTVLLTGIWYGRYKKKMRGKRLADIDDSYEE